MSDSLFTLTREEFHYFSKVAVSGYKKLGRGWLEWLEDSFESEGTGIFVS